MQVVSHLDIPQPARAWLQHSGSLSQQYTRVTGLSMQISLRAEGMSLPFEQECAVLKVGVDEKLWVRRTHLGTNTRMFSYARVVVSEKAFAQHERRWRELGTQLLGDAFLYTVAGLRRSPFTLYQVIPSDALHQEAWVALSQPHEPTEPLWARQSILYLEDAPVLLTEVFLPPFLDYSV
ncbi:MAG: chorismate lyase [Pseudomonadota bacterium]